MRRNIKRSLPGLELIAFTDSSHSPVRRKVELTTSQEQEECVETLRVVEIGFDDSTNSTSFMFEERDLDTSDDDSDSSEEDEITQKTSSSYTKRQQSSAKNWENIREQLLRAVIESECIPEGQVCTNCGTASANYRCLNCGIGNYFCELCVASLHKISCLFHNIEQWKDGMFLPITIADRIVNPRPWHSCLAMETKAIIAISDDGRRHELGVMSCPCEAFPITLARLHLWPTSSKHPNMALSFDLLDWMEALLLECQVSANDFCKALNFKIPKYVIKKDVYPFIIDCFEEYRFMKHELRTLQVFCPERDCGNVCPACPVDGGVLIESLDACFGLPRKKAAGSSVRGPLQGNRVFCSQNEVDKFVDTYPTQPKSSKDCNDFKAGDMLRSKTQFKALDETAVFGRACRHGFPKQFINLKYGERIAYSVWMLKDIIEKSQSSHFNIKIMYDIGCLLFKHLRASGQTDILSKVTFAVPAFHIYGHKAACQLEFSPRRINEFGLSDGEQLERLWSFLRRFSKMTKEMRPSHRIDVLTDAILHYGRLCKNNLVSSLSRNWNRSMECMDASRKNLDDLIEKSPAPLSETFIEELANQEHLRVCGQQPCTSVQGENPGSSESPISIYVDNLRTFYALRSHLCNADEMLDADEVSAITKKIERLDKELAILERSNGIISRWTSNDPEYLREVERKNCKKCSEIYDKIKTVCEERLFLLKLKEKYAEGNALSNKLINQVKKTEKKMKQLLIEYNSARDQLQEASKVSFQELNLERMKQPGAFIMEEQGTEVNPIPSSIKRHAIEMLNLLKRSREEKAILGSEMQQLFNYYTSDEAKISRAISIISSNETLNRYEAGSLALLKSEQKIVQNHVLYIRDSLQNYVELPSINYLPLADPDETIEADERAHTQPSEDV